jgi:hypothetical protein
MGFLQKEDRPFLVGQGFLKELLCTHVIAA